MNNKPSFVLSRCAAWTIFVYRTVIKMDHLAIEVHVWDLPIPTLLFTATATRLSCALVAWCALKKKCEMPYISPHSSLKHVFGNTLSLLVIPTIINLYPVKLYPKALTCWNAILSIVKIIMRWISNVILACNTDYTKKIQNIFSTRCIFFLVGRTLKSKTYIGSFL